MIQEKEKRPVGRPKSTDPDKSNFYRRRLSLADARRQIDREIEMRFVEEVEILEREGRVLSRPQLEKDLKMVYNHITQIKFGKKQLRPSAIQLFKKLYNADMQFIMMGVRDPYHSGSIQGGRKLNIYKPYNYKYRGQSDEEPESEKEAG